MSASVTALVLAGSRAGAADPMARAHGVSHKAVLPVGGVPMLLRVIAALRATPSVGQIVVAIERPSETLRGLDGLAGIELREAEAGPAASAVACFEAYGAPLLVTTADHALLTPAMVAHFLAAAPDGAAAVAAVARRETILAEFPETNRTWLRFRDARVSGCNLFLLATLEARRAVAFWQRLERQRKRPWAMAASIGMGTLARFALGRLTLNGAMRAIGRRCGAPVALVELPFGAAAVDVDKPSDLELVEAYLARQAPGRAA